MMASSALLCWGLEFAAEDGMAHVPCATRHVILNQARRALCNNVQLNEFYDPVSHRVLLAQKNLKACCQAHSDKAFEERQGIHLEFLLHPFRHE